MRGVSLLLASLLFCVVAENLLTVQQQQQITVAINDVRFRLEPAGNLPMLKVDDAIAAKAESWTSQCTFKPDRKLKHLYGTAYLNASKVLSATELVDGWGSEATSISSFISEEFDNARNYRTLIYENATSIGCSMSKCGSTYFYGCLVSPKGDFPGVIPYNPTCTPKYPIDCAAKKSCGSYWDGCKKVVCGPICQSGTTPDNYTYATYGLGWGAVDKKRDSVSVVDWRTRGVVTPIKDQAQCGSCWAFAVTATVETQWAIYKNQLYTQSPQQYVSCSGAGSCGGGYAVTAFNYLNNHYAATESSYPYVSGDGSQPGCQDIGDTETIGTSGGSTRRITLNAASIEAALQKGPVATVIDVNTDFNYYKSGIFNTPCDGYTLGRHVIVIVGYGHDDDTGLDYWIIRNSWNTVWGESGYVRFRKGVNLCGVEGYELYQFIPRGFNFNDQNTGFTPTPYIPPPPPPPPSPPPPPPPSTPDYPQPNTPPPNGGSNTILNSDHIARILQMHNDNRASNCVAALEWDDGISSFAQDYSNNCVNQHNPNRGSYGENIAAAGGTGVNAPSIDRLINYWIDEKSQYQCGTVGSGSAGHWTQMMAAKTTRIGCGLSQCNNIGGGYDTWYLVCNYNPMGNDGTVAYNCPNDGCAPPPPTPTPPAPTPSPPTPPPPPPPSSPNGVPTPNGMTYGFQFLFSGVSSGSLDVGKVQSGICNIVGAGSCSGDMFGTSSAYDDGNGNTWYKFSFSGAYSGYGAALQSAVGANFGTVSSNTGYQCNSWQLSISS